MASIGASIVSMINDPIIFLTFIIEHLMLPAHVAVLSGSEGMKDC